MWIWFGAAGLLRAVVRPTDEDEFVGVAADVHVVGEFFLSAL